MIDFTPPNLWPALPEMFVLAMVCIILVIDAFLKQEQRHITYLLTQYTLLGALLITSATLSTEPTVTFHGHYIKDGISDVLKVGIYLAAAVVFLYSKPYLQERGLFKGEYFLLGLFGVLGMMIMVSAHSFLSLYLGLELLALSQYALVAFDRDSPRAAEAAMKFFVLGALASGMLLYGMSLIYGATGSIIISEVSTAISGQTNDLVLVFGIVFLVVGIAFKFGAVPFHMWVPDVYEGSPTAVTLFIGSTPKIAAFAMAIRLLGDATANLHPDWQQMLIILAALSIALGNLFAIAQTNIKRMLAYSTISHVGFLLLGILAGTPEGYSSAMFYTLSYVIMVTGAFGVLIILSQKGHDAELIQDFRGLSDRDPWLAFLMLLIMMSMAGIPVLLGFHAKLAVLRSVIDAGFVSLAIWSVVFSVIGAFYYLRVVKFIYFERADDNAVPLVMAKDMRVTISINGLLLLLLGLYPVALLALCERAFSSALF